MRNKYYAAAAAIALLTGTNACDQADNPDTSSIETGQNIVSALGDMEGMGTARDFISSAGLEDMLEGEAPYTLFLPNDEAFAKLSEEELQWLRSEEGRPDLIMLLRQHMVPGTVVQKDLEGALTSGGGKVELANLAGTTLGFRRQASTIQIGEDAWGPQISLPQQLAANGVIYKINALIQPES